MDRVMLLQYLEMARVCRVPSSYLVNKGQQVKVFAMILYYARKYGYVVPFTPREADDAVKGAISEQDVTYEGATVIEPIRGFYTLPVVTLDFASLYPSIMIARNLSHDTHLPGGLLPSELRAAFIAADAQLQAALQSLREATAEADNTKTIAYAAADAAASAAAAAADAFVAASVVISTEVDVENLRAVATELQTKKIALETKVNRLYVPDEDVGDGVRMRAMTDDDVFRSPIGEVFATIKNRRGILPRILDELLSARRFAKKAMAEAEDRGDTHMYAVMDKRQLAIKVSANSVYGFTGATVGRLPCLAIAASVTSEGRGMIEDTSEVVVRTYKEVFAAEHGGEAKIIYGDTDSVMVIFPCNFERGADGKLVDPSSAIQQAFIFAITCSEAANKFFPTPHKLEVEKAFYPYLLINKKRYAGGYFEWRWNKPPGNDPECIKTMGLETVRRDNAKMAPRHLQLVLDALMNDFSAERAVTYAQDAVAAMINGPISPDLIAQGCADAAHQKLLAILLDAERCGGIPYDPSVAAAMAAIFHEAFAAITRKNYEGAAAAINAIPIAPHSLEKEWVSALVDVLPEQTLAIDGLVDDLADAVRHTLRLNVTYDDHTISQKWGRQLHLFKGKQPHIEMLKRMKERAKTGRDDYAGLYKPFLGDRLDFILAAPSSIHTKPTVNDRAEDPGWALAHEIQTDPVYYLGQFLRPVARILKSLVGSKTNAYRQVMSISRYKPRPDRSFVRTRFTSRDCLRIWGAYASGKRKQVSAPAVLDRKAATAAASQYKKDQKSAALRGEEAPEPPKRARTAGPLDAFVVAAVPTAEDVRSDGEASAAAAAASAYAAAASASASAAAAATAVVATAAAATAAGSLSWTEAALSIAPVSTSSRYLAPAEEARRKERAYTREVNEAKRLAEDTGEEVVIPDRPTPRGPLDMFVTISLATSSSASAAAAAAAAAAATTTDDGVGATREEGGVRGRHIIIQSTRGNDIDIAMVQNVWASTVSGSTRARFEAGPDALRGNSALAAHFASGEDVWLYFTEFGSNVFRGMARMMTAPVYAPVTNWDESHKYGKTFKLEWVCKDRIVRIPNDLHGRIWDTDPLSTRHVRTVVTSFLDTRATPGEPDVRTRAREQAGASV